MIDIDYAVANILVQKNILTGPEKKENDVNRDNDSASRRDEQGNSNLHEMGQPHLTLPVWNPTNPAVGSPSEQERRPSLLAQMLAKAHHPRYTSLDERLIPDPYERDTLAVEEDTEELGKIHNPYVAPDSSTLR